MENLPSNSKIRSERVNPSAPAPRQAPQPAAEAKPKIEKIVTGKVVQRKRSIGSRLKSTFFGGETRSVWDFVVMDVLRPAAQEMISDAVSQGVERMVFGENRPNHRRPSHSNRNTGFTNYSRFGSSNSSIRRDPRERDHDPRPQVSRQARRTHDFGEVVLDNRHEANEVLTQLDNLIRKYDEATVANFYEMVGATPEFTDEKWGWDDLSTAQVRRARGGGYVIEMPQPIPLA